MTELEELREMVALLEKELGLRQDIKKYKEELDTKRPVTVPTYIPYYYPVSRYCNPLYYYQPSTPWYPYQTWC